MFTTSSEQVVLNRVFKDFVQLDGKRNADRQTVTPANFPNILTPLVHRVQMCTPYCAHATALVRVLRQTLIFPSYRYEHFTDIVRETRFELLIHSQVQLKLSLSTRHTLPSQNLFQSHLEALKDFSEKRNHVSCEDVEI